MNKLLNEFQENKQLNEIRKSMQDMKTESMKGNTEEKPN